MNGEYAISRAIEARLESIENGNACLELRKSGMSQAKIALQLGISLGSVQRLIKKSLRDMQVPDVIELRMLEQARLDAATEAIWPDVIQGDLRAIDRMLRISQRRASLFGLDQPPQGDHTEEYSGPSILEVIPYHRPETEAAPEDGVIPPSSPGVEQQEEDN